MPALLTVVNTLLVKFHTLFLPELSEGPLMASGYHVLEEVASSSPRDAQLCLECLDPRGPIWPTQCACDVDQSDDVEIAR